MNQLERSPTSSRRRLLVGCAGAIALASAGCLGDDDVEPISLGGERACDVCGMIIADHPGPVGQIHFVDDEPEGGRPAQFCSSTCAYTYRFDAADAGREPLATFLTDYSLVDQAVIDHGDDVAFSSHVEADAFSSTAELTVVVGGDVIGAMGPDPIPFSDDADVDAFLAEYGGEPVDAESVDRATVDGS